MSDSTDRSLAPESRPSTSEEAAATGSITRTERAELFRHPDFRRLWLGQAISEVGDGLTGLALLVVLHERTGSAAALGTLLVVTSLPQLALGLHAGVLVDRWDRRRVLIASDVTRALLLAALVIASFAGPLWSIYALAIGQAAAGVFFEPARAALVPALVPPTLLLGANSLLQTTRIVGSVLGAALAGLLLALPSGTMIAFSLDAVSFLVSAAAITAIVARPRPQHEAVEAGHWAALVAGARFLFRSRLLLGLLLTFSVTVLGMGVVNVLFVPFVLGDLGAPTASLGFIRAAQVAGMVGAGAWVAAMSSRTAPSRLLMFGMLGLGLSLAFTAAVHNWLVLIPVLAVSGGWSSAIQSSSSTLLQQGAPNQLRGRVESALDTLLTLIMIAGFGAAGAAADRVGTRACFLLAGALTLLGGLVAHVALHRSTTSSATNGA
jgi:MFS family permease